MAPEPLGGCPDTEGEGDPAAGAKTQILPVLKPIRPYKDIQ
jgi:hypothetical protein